MVGQISACARWGDPVCAPTSHVWRPRVRRDLVVVGASAGGVEALRDLAAGMPADLPAAVLVVLHTGPTVTSRLARILDRSGRLPAEEALDDDRLVPGTIRVARPDHHLVVTDGRVRLSRGPRENFQRPAIDVLFRSAAQARAGRTIGVLLSGLLDDGVDGLLEIRRRGGAAVVQDPDEALYPQLPALAARSVPVDHIAPAAEIGPLLMSLTTEDLPDSLARGNQPADEAGSHSGLICPECGGGLDEVASSESLRFRCRVGHAFGAETLLQAQEDDSEQSLWASVRLFEERCALLAKLEASAMRRGSESLAEHYRRRASEAMRHARAIRRLLAAEVDVADEESIGGDDAVAG